MKVRLLYQDRDWDEEPALTESFRTFRREPTTPVLPRHQQALVQDLAVETLVSSMANGDEFLFEVTRRVLLSGVRNDADTILYRQEIVKDCLENAAVVRDLYAVLVETIGGNRKYYIADYARYPSSILHSAIEALQWYMGMLRKLRDIADAQAARFSSKGFATLFRMLQQEFSEDYFARVHSHLSDLKLRNGVLVSAQLGKGNEGVGYALHQTRDDGRTWLERLLGKGPSAYTFYIHERDEAGGRALGELHDRGINLVANALAQSTDHILSFFEMFRAEMAFYVGGLNLRDTLAPLGAPISFPLPTPIGDRTLACSALYDVCLALQTGRGVVGNTLAANGKRLVIVTGANQGGKSTFLRSVGLAQLMMQCGLFVPAESFSSELCTGVFSHYKREEDATMKSGKFDEELARMNEIVDAIMPNAIVLFNESFSSTNEREGSEIARQIVRALLDRQIRVLFVTHLYDFARSMFDGEIEDALFLRAERLADGKRTFRVVEGEPLETSYGEDLYSQIFPAEPRELDAR